VEVHPMWYDLRARCTTIMCMVNVLKFTVVVSFLQFSAQNV
jgi:hypothetical protein